MSTQKSALEAMLEQYETNNKPKYEKNQEKKVYDLKNYFNTYIKDGVPSATKTIRILPTASGSPFVEFHGHKVLVDGEYKTTGLAAIGNSGSDVNPFHSIVSVSIRHARE